MTGRPLWPAGSGPRRARATGAVARELVRTAVLAVVLLAVAGAAAAQTVERVGSSDIGLDRRLARLLTEDPLIVSSDRRILAGDTIARSVLVLDATLIHEGTILGDLVVVDAGAFVRPESRVAGDLVNMGGGLYRSPAARVDGTIIDLPDATYRVIREDDRLVIEAYAVPNRMALDGFAGFRVPRYDRANGVTATWGGAYQFPRLLGATPVVRARGGWRTEPGLPTYGGSLTLRAGAVTADVGYERDGLTHDDWMMGDTRSSLNYLWDGDDFRNHYDAERAWTSLSHGFGDEAKSFQAVLRVAAQIEDATSLAGGDPWHLLGDEARPNPAIDEGRISSLIGRLDLAWHGLEVDFEAAAEYEAGGEWHDGQYRFERATVGTRFAMHALLDHTLEIRGFGQMPLGTDTLPGQRWSFVGGAATLQTVPLAGYRGDHVVYIESLYRIPTPDALALPVLGAPELQLVHAAGMAWVGEDDPALIQEIGARIQLFGPYIQYMIQPDDPDREEWLVGLAWPFEPGFPWER
ncbi:MAG: hypothetical protein ACN0LA_10200 [Candidatus Longimicrobiales bacterium M2_2A_002]